MLAAYRSARELPADVGNHVVIFTDGRNEDDAGSITLGQLAAAGGGGRGPPGGAHRGRGGGAPGAALLEKALEPWTATSASRQRRQAVGAVFVHVAAGGLHD